MQHRDEPIAVSRYYVSLLVANWLMTAALVYKCIFWPRFGLFIPFEAQRYHVQTPPVMSPVL